MPKRLPRRSFLKILTGAGVATGLAPAVRNVLLEPYVQPPEEELPGRATWYASTCRQCPAGCGIMVRVINGRPRKIEGNPAHPLNRGKLCARGQAGLQVLYNPDRLKNAVRQFGGRGSHRFEPIAWSDALDQVISSLERLSQPERLTILSGMMPDHLYMLAKTFSETLDGSPPVVFDLHTTLEGRHASVNMANRWFNSTYLPLYDISRAEVIFSFGANFLETWMSPVAQSFDYGTMRQGKIGGRGYLVQFEPRLSATGASADEWIPAEPGTEGLIALGLGRIIVEENLGRVGSHREHALLYRNVSVGEVAETSGISAEELLRLAKIFTDVDRSVAIAGGSLAGLTNKNEAMDAIMALNVIMRRLGREGGVFLPHEVPAEIFTSPVTPSPFSEVLNLIERMQNGQVEVLFIHGSNPVYEIPPWAGFTEALSNVSLVISFSPFIDETAVHADIVLPDHTYLEGWGYQVVSPTADRPTVSSQQPVARPLYDTRSTTDVLLALAARLGGEVAELLPWTDEVAFLEETASHLLGSSIGAYDARTASSHWSLWRQYGGWWSENPIRHEPDVNDMLSSQLMVSSATFAGDEEKYPFYLFPYESLTLSDGRGASQPWLQETPDPMTTARWNTWVEINPETAKRLGVTDNDMVRVYSIHGELEAAVVVYPGIRPDVVAIPTGQGHQDSGRFAAGRGVNVMDLIAPLPGVNAKQLAWGSTRVQIEPVGRTRKLARLESLVGEGRESIR
ncbi:MAG: molybdopterin-dependent oxidoreductase [Anaerolineales bacterium]|nr:molybdopterin-dependent oxidoreductase [Anaerolineales bacterium]